MPKCGSFDVQAVVVAAFLATTAVLLAVLAVWYSPTADEIAYLPSGLSHWKFGRFELYRANPPAVRLVATAPLLACDPAADWSSYHVASRPEFAVGRDFLTANGADSFWYFTLARFACIPFALLGGCFVYAWAKELYGAPSGVLAASLWCFSPEVLGHGALLTPDVASASFGVAACYAFWHWLKSPGWTTALIAGVALGCAELVKSNWLVLYPLLPLAWLLWIWQDGNATWPSIRLQLAQGASILALSLLLLNALYGFDGSFKPLGDYCFQSETFSGQPVASPGGESTCRNRFSGTWLAALPVPLPEQYVLGIDDQRKVVDRGRPAFLFGEWKHKGWWHYYLAAALVKLPPGVLLLLAGCLVVRCMGWMAWTKGEIFLLAPAAATLLFISSQTGINRHFRYALPILPFLFIWASSLWTLRARFEVPRILAAGCVLWAALSSLLVFPHSLCYFNEIAGGPARGHKFLLDSNVDWGQSLFFIKHWIDAHPEARPLHLSWTSDCDARLAGVDLPPCPEQPSPGWHIVSVNHIYAPGSRLAYFAKLEPVDRIAYAWHVYRIDELERQANTEPLP